MYTTNNHSVYSQTSMHSDYMKTTKTALDRSSKDDSSEGRAQRSKGPCIVPTAESPTQVTLVLAIALSMFARVRLVHDRLLMDAREVRW